MAQPDGHDPPGLIGELVSSIAAMDEFFRVVLLLSLRREERLNVCHSDETFVEREVFSLNLPPNGLLQRVTPADGGNVYSGRRVEGRVGRDLHGVEGWNKENGVPCEA